MPTPGGPSSALVTLDDVREQLNYEPDDTSDDQELQDIIEAATAVIENITGPVVEAGYTEWHDGGKPKIFLEHFPVISVTSVTEYAGTTATSVLAEPVDGGAFTDYGYDVDLEQGIISRSSSGYPVTFTYGTRVRVIYTAGRSEVPYSIRLAARKLIDHWWADQRGTGSGRAIPGATEGDEFQDPVVDRLIPFEVAELLEPYRKAPTVA